MAFRDEGAHWVDAGTGIVHSMSATRPTCTMLRRLTNCCTAVRRWCGATPGIRGGHKREENLGLEVEWRVAMRPGLRRKLEPGSEEALTERAKAAVRAKVEHPFLRLKRLFGYGKSLPPSPIGGALPRPGEEHGTPGIVAGAGQPDDSGGSTAGLTWRPAVPNPSSRVPPGSLQPRQGRNHRAKTISGSGKRCLTYKNPGPRTKRPAEPPLVHSILR